MPCVRSHSFVNSSNHLSWLSKTKSTSLGNDDSNNHAVNTENTSHDNGDEWFHDNSWSPYWDAADSGSCFSSSVGCSEILISIALLARTRARLTPINPKNAAPALSWGVPALISWLTIYYKSNSWQKYQITLYISFSWLVSL